MISRFSLAEYRLLGRTLEDFNQTTKINSRNAQIQADNQNAQRQAQVAANQALITQNPQGLEPGQQNLAAPVTGVPQQSLNQNATPQWQTYDATTGKTTVAPQLGQLDQSAVNRLMESGMTEGQARQQVQDLRPTVAQTMSNTGLGGTARQSATLNPQDVQGKIDQKIAEIDSRYNQLRSQGSIVDSAGVEREKQAAIQQIIGQAQIQQSHEQQQYQRAKDQMAQGAATNTGAQQSKTDQPKNNAPWLDAAIAGLPPEYQIIGQSLKGTLDAQAQEKAAAAANLGIETAAADASQKAYGELLGEMRKDSDLFYKEAKSMAEDNQQRREESLAAEKKATLERLAWEENKATRDARKALDKQINKLVAGQAIGGGFGSSNWTKMVAEAEYEGETAILDMQKEFGFKRTDVDIAYTQTLDNIYSTAAQQKLDALKAHRSDIQQINQFKFSAAEKTDERKANAKKEYNKTLASIAKEQAASIKEATNTVISTMNQIRDDKRAQEKLGWDILDDAVARYGSLIPKSTIDRVSAMLPAGTDIQDYINTPTIAERNSKRISGSGGRAGGTGGVPSPSDATATALYSNITPQQLKEAVARAFAPANYGGTAGERATRQNEYMSRIASGESPASIMQSLATDYWSSQKGAPRTAHDGRTEAQASAESLQSYVDHYGIASGDDGALGAIDSRVQAMLSVFDKSSEEYNNLATNVGNIRARIIKENYGAAVTPQELEIAKSYIPSMTDKGAVFTTKLQNLKSYQAYLDAKVSASALGLPAPKPPTPVSLSGDKMSGPAKYSAADITSALLE